MERSLLLRAPLRSSSIAASHSRRRSSTMIPCDAPCSPPPLPTWSILSGLHLPSSLYMLPPPPLYPPLLPSSVNIANNHGNLSTGINNFSGRKSSSDSCGYPKDTPLPDDPCPDDTDNSEEGFVEHLIGTSLYSSIGRKSSSVIPKLDCRDCPKEEASLPDDLLLPDDSQELLGAHLIGKMTCSVIPRSDCRCCPKQSSLPDDLYSDDSQGRFIRSLIDEVLYDSSKNIVLNKHNNHKGCSSEFNSFYLEPPEAKSSLTSDLSAKQDVSAQELHQPYGKTDFKFSLDKDFFADYLIESVGDNFSSESSVVQDIHNEDFAESSSPTPKQNQPLENVLITSETEGDCNRKGCNGKQFNTESEQANSSLSTEISRLKTLVENLTHQVQDLSDKLSCQKKFFAPCVDENAEDGLFYRTEDKRQKPDNSFASITDWGAAIVDQSFFIAIATDYFPSRIISAPGKLNQPTSGRQSAVVSAFSGKVKEVDQQFKLSGKTKSTISPARQKMNSEGSAMPKDKYIFPRVSFLSGAFNKVRRAATNVGSKMKRN